MQMTQADDLTQLSLHDANSLVADVVQSDADASKPNAECDMQYT